MKILIKKNVLFLSLQLLLITSCSENFSISGEVGDEVDTITLKQLDPETGDYYVLETQYPENSKYEFKVAQQPTLYSISFDDKDSLLISGLSEKNAHINCIEDIKIVDAPSSQRMKAFKLKNGELQGKYFGALKKEADAAMKANDQQALKNIQARSGEAIQAFLVEFHREIKAMDIGPEGYFALGFTDFNKDRAFVKQQLTQYKESFPNSPITRDLERRVGDSDALALGNRPPNFKLINTKGSMTELKSIEAEVLLIDFWAAWCRACRIENPEFAKLYEDYNSRGFEIISISQDKTEDKWKKAIEKDGVEAWTHVWDKNDLVSRQYGVSSLPQNILLDKAGKIVAKNVKALDLKQILEKTLYND
ncbi:TlpA family protein disulfide reductase [Croceitalea rosinachiae]|uniref:TlpA disulfide reductase family protein n=1 Tax=Croceitalea rosinachiae TaxID=3075596 RepID=A0ABU3A8T6_9FLAO|nr:TlpA disulfide reductase family protein [Croceitalea sp. F388]MDT0605503.1 TlpA disulfide reductase family protein [Croceitalea sp. F388]